MNPTDGQKFIGRVSSMSKTLLTSFIFAYLLVSGVHAYSNKKSISVDLIPDWQGARVELILSDIPDNDLKAISFPSRIAGFDLKSDRIISVELRSGDGGWLTARRASPFVFIVPDGITHLRISIDVSAPEDPFARPFVSWMDGGNGLFILADLVPIELEGPVSVKSPYAVSHASYPNIESAVISLLGREAPRARRDGISIARIGDWNVANEEIFAVLDEIVSDYSRRFGNLKNREIDVVLIRAVGVPGRWSARTVGSSVILSSSGMPFQSQEVQRLHEQMRHELFHLWIPNSLELKGDYATFYEGFALYQSLKSGVAIGRIRFVDFLSTLSAAIRISERVDLRIADGGQWRDDRESLYAAGLVSAFATDVSLITTSGGRQSSDSFIREFLVNNQGLRAESQKAIRDHFAKHSVLQTIGVGDDLMIRRDSLASILSKAGLQRSEGSLAVISDPSGSQKKVLELLGYNARARLVQMPTR